MNPINVTRRVAYRGGWLGLFSGESQGKALERVIPQLNAEGYRVVFVVPDRWSIAKLLLSVLIAILTLFIFVPTPNLLIIAERTG